MVPPGPMAATGGYDMRGICDETGSAIAYMALGALGLGMAALAGADALGRTRFIALVSGGYAIVTATVGAGVCLAGWAMRPRHAGAAA